MCLLGTYYLVQKQNKESNYRPTEGIEEEPIKRKDVKGGSYYDLYDKNDLIINGEKSYDDGDYYNGLISIDNLKDKEVQNNMVAVRSRKEGDVGAVKVDEFITKIRNEIINYEK